MTIGFVGLGSVGAKLAGNLVANGVDLMVYDLDPEKVSVLCHRGARAAHDLADMIDRCDTLITCLPSPSASAAVIEANMPKLGPGKTWIEMSTTDEAEIRRLGELVRQNGGDVAECPVSGGCHRAATGNISIFMGGDRETFERIMPLLTIMGRRILHTGELGSASILKVMTNYLATANLLTLCEALVTMKAAGLDMATTYEAIRISSGNSFVHETESQLILSGSRDVNFTMNLVQKDIGLFQQLAERHGIDLEISPLLIEIMSDGQARYGEYAQSDRIVERLEEQASVSLIADGFPMELLDDEPEQIGHEIVPQHRDAT